MAVYICFINSCVHIIMYSYYFLTSFKSLRESLMKIKPLITIVQLTQLVLIFSHSVVVLLPHCGASKLFYTQLVNGFILIGLFSKFYVDNYSKIKSKEE